MGEMTHVSLLREGEPPPLQSPALREVRSSCASCPQLVGKGRMSHGNRVPSWVHRLRSEARLLHLLSLCDLWPRPAASLSFSFSISKVTAAQDCTKTEVMN